MVHRLLGATLLSAGAAQTAAVTWNSSADPDVVSYNLYYGVASGNYTNEISVGNVTNVTVSGLVDGTTYYFAATAVDELVEESAFSAEISYTVPTAAARLGPPSMTSSGFSFSVSGVTGYFYVIQSSVDLVNWYPIATNAAPFSFVDPNARQSSQTFYRAVYYP